MGSEGRTEAVRRAFTAVGRHRFLPQVSRAEADADAPVVTHRDAQGRPTSSASQPAIVLAMLDQLELRPGLRVLEIGAGTGFNAAVMAELVGTTGSVVTVDIQPDVAAEARSALDRTGYDRVITLVGDGSDGAAGHAPFDRIIVTAGAWDLPRPWFDQLRPAGRLVVPLRWRGQTQSVAFVRAADHLYSQSLVRCGFMPLVGQAGEQTAPVDNEGGLTLTYDADQHVQPAALAEALLGSAQEIWSGVYLGRDQPISSLWLRLSEREPGTVGIAVTAAAVASGRFRPAVPSSCPAVARNDSLAYVAARPLTNDQDGSVELGAIGFGPLRAELARRLVSVLHTWDGDREAMPTVQAWPRGAASVLTEVAAAIPKPSVQLVLVYGDPPSGLGRSGDAPRADAGSPC